jgi:hypothetical protein
MTEDENKMGAWEWAAVIVGGLILLYFVYLTVVGG